VKEGGREEGKEGEVEGRGKGGREGGTYRCLAAMDAVNSAVVLSNLLCV